MSTNIISKTAFAVVATAGLTFTAYAGNGSGRYGGPSVYDYESGGNCSSAACAQAPVQYQGVQHQHIQHPPAATARYGVQQQQSYGHHSGGMNVSPGVVYVDCQTMGTCAPQPSYQQPVYQPQPTYSHQGYTSQTYSTSASLPAECPAGTTAQSDGTCMQSSYSSTSSYSTGSTYSGSSYSGNSYSGETVACPAGTSKQSDGSCLQSSSSSYSTSSYSSTPSYSSSTSYSSGSSTPVNCPSGTTAQSDGTCMEGGSVSSYVGGSATIYSGDAQVSGSSYGGYASDGGYSANSYLPIRK